ncbi:hypothetical protein D3Y57_19325 [Sphingomonas paeninsulae]|uniref:Uncharacterized protein n=1 Tax=Sphingomonas paeninsulae TaxID=2319844 RepID=A0A494TRE8_SPHPE|nr:hypothetical protein [Sphingomonas paeninsulae]AYJ87685.1 hypothetical protein D3Y57_19325 [Sphingomonas paeninsulae]
MTVRIADFTTGTYTGITPANVSASGGYAQTVAGVLTSFAANLLRRTDKGLLVEPAATNLLKYSQQLDNGYWGHDGTSTADFGAAPDGTTTADKQADNGSGFVDFNTNTNSNTVTASTAYIISGYFKRITASKQPFIQQNQTFNSGSSFAADVQYFNVDTLAGAGTETLAGNNLWSNATVEALGSSWFRFAATLTSYAGSPVFREFFGLCDATGSRTVAASSSALFWNPQLEIGSGAPSSPILTTSAAATRAADAVSFTVPVGATTLTFTFDDNSTITVGVTAGVAYTIPTSFSRRYIKYVDDNETGGGTTYTQAVSSSGAGVASLARLAAYKRSLTTTGVGVLKLQRTIALRKTFTGVGVASLARKLALGKPISATGIGLVALATMKAKGITISATGIGLTALQRAIAVTKSASGTGVASLNRLLALGRAVSASGVGIASVSRTIGLGRSIAASGTGLVTLATFKAKSITVTAAGIGIASLNRIIAAGRSIAATGIGLASIVRSVSRLRTISASGASFVTLGTLKAKSLTVAVSGVGLASIQRGMSKTLNFAGVGVAIFNRIVPVRITASGVGAAFLTWLRPSGAIGTSRILRIAAEIRSFVIGGENRALPVEPENRTDPVPHEN